VKDTRRAPRRQGKFASCKPAGGSVTVDISDTAAPGAPGGGAGSAAPAAQPARAAAAARGAAPHRAERWAVVDKDLPSGGAARVSGAKSANLVALRAAAPSWVLTPRSAVLPFGCFNRALEAPENKAAADAYARLAAEIVPAAPASNPKLQVRPSSS
jgi:hypothetical protein